MTPSKLARQSMHVIRTVEERSHIHCCRRRIKYYVCL